MFVCLGFFVPLEFFTRTDYGDVTIGDEELQILTYAWNLLLSIEQWVFGFSVSHLLYTGHPFIMVISENPWQSHQAFSNGAVTTCFCDLGLSQLGHSACETNALTHGTTALVKEAMNTLSFRHLCKPWLMVAFFYSLVQKENPLFKKKKVVMVGRNLHGNKVQYILIVKKRNKLSKSKV